MEDLAWKDEIQALQVFIPHSRLIRPARVWRSSLNQRVLSAAQLASTGVSFVPVAVSQAYSFSLSMGRSLALVLSLRWFRDVKMAGFTTKVSSHSLRIGGATAAMMAGISREQIMSIGGWSSSAVDRYLRAVEITRLHVSDRMGL